MDDNGTMRKFESGATRDTAEGKLDMEGFLSPMVLRQFAKYMNMHRLQADGTLRGSDNWQKGMDKDVYMKSMFRHFFDTWTGHRGFATPNGMIANLCGMMFNTMGYLLEWLKEHPEQDFDGDEPIPEIRYRRDKLMLADVQKRLKSSDHDNDDSCECEECEGIGDMYRPYAANDKAPLFTSLATGITPEGFTMSEPAITFTFSEPEDENCSTCLFRDTHYKDNPCTFCSIGHTWWTPIQPSWQPPFKFGLGKG